MLINTEISNLKLKSPGITLSLYDEIPDSPFFSIHLSDILLDTKNTFFLSEILFKIENLMIEKPFNVRKNAILSVFNEKGGNS